MIRSLQVATPTISFWASNRPQMGIRMAQELGFEWVRFDAFPSSVATNDADATFRDWTTFDAALLEVKNRNLKLILNFNDTRTVAGVWLDPKVSATGRAQNLAVFQDMLERAFSQLSKMAVLPTVMNEPWNPTFGGDMTVSTVTGITNASPPVVTTSANHNLAPGRQVYLYNVVGANGANGRFVVGTVTATTFQLLKMDGVTNADAPGVWSSGGTVKPMGIFSAYQPLLYGDFATWIAANHPEVSVIHGQFSGQQSEPWVADASAVNWDYTAYPWQQGMIPSVSLYIEGFDRMRMGAMSYQDAYVAAKQFYNWTLSNLQGADATMASMAILETGTSPFRAGMTGGTAGSIDPRYECRSQDQLGQIKAAIYNASLESSTVPIRGHGNGLVSFYASTPAQVLDAWEGEQNFWLGPYQAAPTVPIYYRHANYIAECNGVALPSSAQFAPDP